MKTLQERKDLVREAFDYDQIQEVRASIARRVEELKGLEKKTKALGINGHEIRRRLSIIQGDDLTPGILAVVVPVDAYQDSEQRDLLFDHEGTEEAKKAEVGDHLTIVWADGERTIDDLYIMSVDGDDPQYFRLQALGVDDVGRVQASAIRWDDTESTYGEGTFVVSVRDVEWNEAGRESFEITDEDLIVPDPEPAPDTEPGEPTELRIPTAGEILRTRADLRRRYEIVSVLDAGEEPTVGDEPGVLAKDSGARFFALRLADVQWSDERECWITEIDPSLSGEP